MNLKFMDTLNSKSNRIGKIQPLKTARECQTVRQGNLTNQNNINVHQVRKLQSYSITITEK